MSEENIRGDKGEREHIQMSYHRLVPHQVEGKEPTLAMVLRSTKLGGAPIEYEVPIPPIHAKEYQKAIHNIVLQRGVEQTLLDALQKDVGVYIRKVMVDVDSAEEREATLYTLSEYGEVASFKASEHNAVLYALMHELPIFVHKSLTEIREYLPNSINDTNILTAEERVVLLNEANYKEAILDGKKPEELFKTPDDYAELWDFDKEQLEALLQQAVEVENYEWAQFIKEHLESRAQISLEPLSSEEEERFQNLFDQEDKQ